jgi:transcription antitermination factor NusG
MPTLKQEPDMHPDDLLDRIEQMPDDAQWYLIYTIARQEKKLMRWLLAQKEPIPFYGPTFEKRSTTPKGRATTSFNLLFPGYVFLHGTNEQRHHAMKSNCISRCYPVDDQEQLTQELRQIYRVITSGEAISPVEKLQTGDRVEVTQGKLKRMQGMVIRAEGQTHLQIAVDFLQQGASLEIDKAWLKPLET